MGLVYNHDHVEFSGNYECSFYVGASVESVRSFISSFFIWDFSQVRYTSRLSCFILLYTVRRFFLVLLVLYSSQ